MNPIRSDSADQMKYIVANLLDQRHDVDCVAARDSGRKAAGVRSEPEQARLNCSVVPTRRTQQQFLTM